MSDIWAIIIGAVFGVLNAPVLALLIIALLRARHRMGVPWSVVLARPGGGPELHELSAQSPLTLSEAQELLS